MPHRDPLSAASARIDALERELRGAKAESRGSSELRERVERLEHAIAQHRDAETSSPPVPRRQRGAPRIDRVVVARILPAVALGVSLLAPLIALVPGGRYYGSKSTALLVWVLGSVLTPAGLACALARGRAIRFVGVALVIAGAWLYWKGWSWAAELGFVHWTPFG